MVGSVSGTVPYLDDQVVRYDWKYLLSEQVLPDRMASWRDSVLAAEAKKAGNASEITRLTPRPPSSAWNQKPGGTSGPQRENSVEDGGLWVR